jgi:D-3-phosphoglycerate dehydrogenase
MIIKVVITGNFSEETRSRILEVFPAQWEMVFVAQDHADAALTKATAVIPEHMKIDGPVLDRAKHLRLVQTGAGYDNVDIQACTQRGVWAANAAGINAGAVAEHVLALVLCRYKNIALLDGCMKRGEYKIGYCGGELSRKTIGIVGMGHIGKAVARLSHAFGLTVLGCHPRSIEVPKYIRLTDLETLLRRSDIVTLHTPLNAQTRHLIGRQALASMKADALLVNTSRGTVLDEQALVDALAEKRIGGAALDVFETEPLPPESPLRRLSNVLLTPHTAGSPDGPRFHRKRFEFFRENIRRVSEGKAPMGALNRPDARG